MQEIIGISELAVRKKESRKQVEIVGMCKKLGFLGLKKGVGWLLSLGVVLWTDDEPCRNRKISKYQTQRCAGQTANKTGCGEKDCGGLLCSWT